jgi:uncharacterized lipoprotein YddW (UPF0748 family)
MVDRRDRRRTGPGVTPFLILSQLLFAVHAGAQAWEWGDPYAAHGLPTDTVAPPLGREFRAVWIATVANIDWPSKPGLPVAELKRELREQFDLARRLRLNAIVFQVRPAADALYKSPIEPWSFFLTGQMGRAPQPAFDPLAFAIDEAHARGMELHAWFNPYRARHPGDKSPRAAPGHITRKSPQLVHRYGPYTWMDPGEPAVRRLTTRVILDVVDRYDVDGVHIDDYFYPYPELNRRRQGIPFPDDRSWGRYVRAGGPLSRDDWRRKNVDDLVHELYDAIKKRKAWVKFGISPFGIWRPGYPENVRGFDSWDRLYADSRRWLNEGWIDYFTPQLYWRTTAPQQPYADLLKWWQAENRRGRHLWPGNFTSRASAARTQWPTDEVFDQIYETRLRLQPASGNVHFSMKAFLVNTDSLVERLVAGPYAEPVLVPASPWLSGDPPDAPQVTLAVRSRGVELTIVPADRTARATPGTRRPRWWVVRALYPGAWHARIVSAKDSVVRLAVAPDGTMPRYLTVSAVDHVGNESPTGGGGAIPP